MNVNFLTVYIIFVICFFVPSTAFAYLDPGTGNALIYVLLSLGGAVIYVAKNAYYKITCNSKKKNNMSILEKHPAGNPIFLLMTSLGLIMIFRRF